MRVRKHPEYMNHLVRMLYSCLVDADYLDTERFMTPESYAQRGGKPTLEQLLPRLEKALDTISANSKPSKVNSIRREVQQLCREKANMPQGFYSLSVPTGGGKTLSSLLWAMRHAVTHGQRRIVIAIPYTSIIVQTAAVLRSIFNADGEDNVLEHHSAMEQEEKSDNSDDRTSGAQLATENWDYPIVVTTNVQLFESMYANRPSRCRKLHNLANSVIILDEVQSLPTDFLQPIVDGLQAYVGLFGASVLFTTASMPALKRNDQFKLKGIEEITEIMRPDMRLHERLKRVELHIDDDTRLTPQQVAEQMCKYPRVLCIVNTRGRAREVFEQLPDEGLRFHLSKNMTNHDIALTLKRIKEALKEETQPIVRVVATQLVEAGVDIDFPVVMREQAGLDSVLQAAGRCNREGREDVGQTVVFAMEGGLPRGFMTQCNNARLNMRPMGDLQSPEAMHEYFTQLFCRVDDFDKPDTLHRLNKGELNFESVADDFHLIEDADSATIIIPTDKNRDDMATLRQLGVNYAIIHRLQRDMVTTNNNGKDVTTLKEAGALTEVADRLYLLDDESQYDSYMGLHADNH